MSGFNGLGLHLGNISRLSTAKTRSISPENFTGEKGKGGMFTPTQRIVRPHPTDCSPRLSRVFASTSPRRLGDAWETSEGSLKASLRIPQGILKESLGIPYTGNPYIGNL